MPPLNQTHCDVAPVVSPSSTVINLWDAPPCQPYGAVLLINKSGCIVALTDTTCHFLQTPEISLTLGLVIEMVCPPLYDVWMERLEQKLDPLDWSRIRWNDQEYDARAVPHGDYWLIDVWPAADKGVDWEDVQNIATIVRGWLQQQSFSLDSGLEKYRQWLGFDMVVVYQLHENGENEITAEAKNDDMPSLKGLRYPVAQLGSFAEAIGLQNVARTIVDSCAESALWWSIDAEIDPAIADLSVCRELDEHHRHMMAKLGFRSAVMLPLVMDGHVQGLLIAYNRIPRIMGGNSMLVSRIFFQSLSLKLNEHVLKTKFAYEQSLSHAMGAIEHLIRSRAPDLEGLLTKHSLEACTMVQAEGIVLWRHATDSIHTFGDHPLDAQAPEVRAWLEWISIRIPSSIDAYATGMYVCDFLQGSYPNSVYANGKLENATGWLGLRLPNRDILVFTKRQSLCRIDTQDSNNDQWGPAHIRTLHGHASSWGRLELQNASTLLSLLCEQLCVNGEQRSFGTPESYTEAVLLFSPDGRVMYMNQLAREGIARIAHMRDAGNGYNLRDLMHAMPPEQHGIVRNAFDVSRKRGKWEGELEVYVSQRHAVFKGCLQTHSHANGEMYFSLTARDVTAVYQAKQEQEYLELQMPLAQSTSSEQFRISLAAHLESHKRSDAERMGLLLLVDLDGTKNFVRSIGQEATNEISYWVHLRLQHSLGVDVTISHIGTDEFGVIVPDIQNEKQAWLIANSVLQTIARPMWLNNYVSEDAIKLTACVGMALFLSHASTVPDLLIAADNAMYAAKRAGKGQARMHEPHSSTHVAQKFHLVGELRRAIQNNELRTYFQPQFNALTHQIIGAEALVRWEHPERGLLMPNFFISVAEDSGLIDKLGEWVLHDTMRQLGAWPKTYRENMVVSVNASVRQLRDREHFLYMLDTALAKYKVSPKNLEIEITETIWIDKNDDAVSTLHALRKRGISVAIDDFGTGYSNIAYLQSFPVDKLKFDRSFVQAGQESQGGREILRAMVQLARALNVRVLAEGVETKDQEAMLLEVGIENMQGYAYSQPLSEQAFLSLLERRRSQPLLLPFSNNRMVN